MAPRPWVFSLRTDRGRSGFSFRTSDPEVCVSLRYGEFLERILAALLARQNTTTAGWGYYRKQDATEPTCFALLALWNSSQLDNPGECGWSECQRRRAFIHALDRFQLRQNPNGSWSAFKDDDQTGCSTTALALVTLMQICPTKQRLQLAIYWLLDERGREGHWFWRWKFQTIDNKVEFNPAKFGWGWLPGTTSWVIPTAFALIALQQVRSRGLSRSEQLNHRVELGSEMLLDRMCPGGGWNAGNGVVFGIPLAPHIDATAIALLALKRHGNENGVQESLVWLVGRLPKCPSPCSLAWGLLALTAYRDSFRDVAEAIHPAAEQLVRLVEDPSRIDDTCTLAISALAIEAMEGENVFEVKG